MNDTTTYPASTQQKSAASAGTVLRELVAAMPIVVLIKAVRAVFSAR